ncbi:MAG: hypothetical protein II623_03845 [Paludibacteraceae bacterium]|nr:hypothetical protein [Paludibacteraceae bacterium]
MNEIFKIHTIRCIAFVVLNLMAFQRVSAQDSNGVINYTIPDVLSFKSSESELVYRIQPENAKRYKQIENGKIETVKSVRTGVYQGQYVYSVVVSIVPNAGADSIRITELDKEKNIVDQRVLYRNPRILKFIGQDEQGNEQTLSIIHEWDSTKIRDRKKDLKENVAYFIVYNKGLFKKVVRSKGYIDITKPIKIQVFYNGVELKDFLYSQEPYEYSSSMYIFGTYNSPNFDNRLIRDRESVIVIKKGNLEYPYFELSGDDFKK